MMPRKFGGRREHLLEHVVRNPAQLAFCGGGDDIAPVYWEDNYFSLISGEERTVSVAYPKKLLGGAQSYIQVDAFNVSN